jgi:hypothetical protein
MVQRTLIRPPMSRVGPLTPDERKAINQADAENQKKYAVELDRESAHERLQSRNTMVGQLKQRLSSFSNILRGKG